MNFIIAFCIANSLFLCANAETREVGSVADFSPFALTRAASSHQNIINEFQPTIDALTGRITLQAAIADLKISGARSSLQQSVNKAVALSNEDILIVREHIARELQKSSSSRTNSCLQIQNVMANSLTTNQLGKCLSSNLDTADELRMDIKRLQSTTSTIGTSCNKSNPLASQAPLMRNCVIDKIGGISATLDGLIEGLTSEIASAESETMSCIEANQKSLTIGITTIVNAAVLC